MTRREITNIRDLTFSGWVRNNLPDSSTGFMASDLDFILQNYQTKKIMLLEIKTRNSDLKNWQKRLFKNIHTWIANGINDNWQYLGFHVIQFENTNFNDGRVYFDYKISSENKIKKILSL
jgi:hypothetical protein